MTEMKNARVAMAAEHGRKTKPLLPSIPHSPRANKRARRQRGTLADFAELYAELGYRVLPCRGKVPLIKGGVHSATTDADQVRQWWAKWPDANVAIACGNGLAVVDVDPAKGGLESLAALEAEWGSLPEAWRVTTGGGGLHIYLTVKPNIVIANRTGLRPGIDVRGDGGYVVAPPSGHESGGVYYWPGPIELSGPQPMPADWLAYLRTKGRRGKVKPKRQRTNSRPGHRAEYGTAALKLSLGTKQRVKRVVRAAIVTAPGTRHLKLLDTASAFNRIQELRSLAAEFFKPVIFAWWEASRAGGNVNGGWEESWADWVRLWDGSRDRSYTTPVDRAFADAMSKPFPPTAAKYRAPKMQQLVALIHELAAVCADENGVWYLSCRAAAAVLSVEHVWASKCLRRLVFDGVIEVVEDHKRGSVWAMRYRLVDRAGESNHFEGNNQ